MMLCDTPVFVDFDLRDGEPDELPAEQHAEQFCPDAASAYRAG
jgi:hypothetical protein